MSKVYVQKANTVWQTSASIATVASATSGSFPCQGFARLTGLVISTASLVPGSAIRVWQSADNGSNFDYKTEFGLSGCSCSAFSIELVGNAAKIDITASSDGASIFRTTWVLRPV